MLTTFRLWPRLLGLLSVFLAAVFFLVPGGLLATSPLDPSTALFKGTLLGPSGSPTASVTSTYLDVSLSIYQSVSWDHVPAVGGSPNLRIQILQANTPAGPFNLLPSPSAAGTVTVNSISVTSASGLSDFLLIPSNFVEVVVTNLDSHGTTLTSIIPRI